MIHNNARNIISNVTINKNVRRTRNIRTFGTVEHSDELLFNEQLVNLRLQKKNIKLIKYLSHTVRID